MRPLRIGINALYLIPGGVGGTEIYLRSLLAALPHMAEKHEYFVFLNRETTAELLPRQERFHAVLGNVAARNRPLRIGWEQTLLPVQAARLGLDVLFNPGFTAPALCPCPSVTVFHDLQHKRHPEYFRWWDLPFWRLFLFQSAVTAERLIAVSEATRKDLLRYYPVDAHRVQVVHHGVDERFFEIGRARAGAAQPLLLCVSTLHPHKNLDALVEVFAAFHRRRPDYRLVIAGMKGFQSVQLERQVRELGLDGAVELTGWIGREALYQLFRQAGAFIYPSRFEGFGMPVVEAMAAGIPTACSDIAPLREIAGDAALFFDASSREAMAGAMERICLDEDLRARLVAAGARQARKFSWDATARATLAVLHQAARL